MKGGMFFLVIISMVVGGSFVSGETVFPGEVFGYGNTKQIPINFSEIPTVNSSDWWITDIGSLSTVNEAQFNNIGGVLTVDESHFNLLYCQLTGCTMSGDIDMNGNSVTDILSTHYNISGCADNTFGTFCYDSTYDTMRFVTDSGQVLQMNQETTMPAKNIEGSTMPDGSIVYIMGATGANPNSKFAKADELNTSGLVGVVTKECINNQVCPVVFFGLVHGFDTSSFVAGDHLYISDTEAGNFTTTPPEFPNVPIWVATVIRVHPDQGTIFVFPRLDSSNGITMNNLGLIGDFIQTDYSIKSVPGNDAIDQNVFTIQMNGTTGIEIPHLVLQPGGSGQASVWVRSGIVVPESVLCLNNTNRTEPTCFADEGNYTWKIANFNTSIAEGADWGITGELEVIKDAYIHGNISTDGQVNVTGNVIIQDRLFVGIEPSETTVINNPGDGVFRGNLFVSNGTFTGFPDNFGPSLLLFSFGDDESGQVEFFFDSSGELNTTTGRFCDFTNDPFSTSSLGKIIAILTSTELGTAELQVEILSIENVSCSFVNLGIFGGESVLDLSSINYAIAPLPVASFYDRGLITFDIGEGDATNFKINAHNVTGQGKLILDTIAGGDNVLPFALNSDQFGWRNMINFVSFMDSSRAVEGTVQRNMVNAADLSNYTNGEYTALNIEMLNTGINMSKTAMQVSSEFDSIITVGQAKDIDRAYYDDTSTTVDITNDINNSASGTLLFEDDNSIVYLGNEVNFTELTVSVAVDSTQDIESLFYYCNSSSEYQLFNVSDNTEGFTHSGTINFINPINRGKCNQEIDGTPLADTTNHTYIAIQRTAALVTSPPIVGTINIFDKSSRYIIGNDGLSEADFAMGFINEEFQQEGSITHYFESKNFAGQILTNFWTQTGKNESYSGVGNSFGVVPNYIGKDNFSDADGKVNMTQLSNYPLLCFTFGIDCSFNADTLGNAIDLIPGGPLLWTMGDAEIWQSLKVHKGMAVEGPSIFDLKGDDANFNNGSVHIATPVTFQQGFTEGDSVTKFTETFASTLGIFTNIQTDLGDWSSILNTVFCDEGQCAQADGAGVGIVSIQTNVSTLDINETQLSFVYSLFNLIGSGELSVTVNNNVGSGDVEVFSDTTDNIEKEPEVISLPSSMDNESIVTITVTCDAGSAAKPTRQCYFDTVKLNGTAISTTLINVSGFDSVIKFGDGTLAADGFPERGIIYNASGDTIIIRGNATFENIIEQDLEITNSIELNGTTIFDWAGVINSPLFPGYFLLNGSSVMQGDTNLGGFNVENVENLTTSDGGKLWSNSTCTFLSSPAGTTVVEVCDA